VLVVGIIVAVMVALLAAVLLTRRASHDDVHSVEGYHRSLHTLEVINAHPAVSGAEAESDSGLHGRARPAHAESSLRRAGTATVRVTDAPPASDIAPPVTVPPVNVPPASVPLVTLPLPPGADPNRPMTFDDATPAPVATPPSPGSTSLSASSSRPGSIALPAPTGPPAPPEAGHHRDKAMSSINHRPRRLAAPAAAIGGVGVLIVVLLVTGSHHVAPPRHHGSTATTRHSDSKGGTHSSSTSPGTKVTTTPSSVPPPTPTTQPPAVSPPQSSTASSATYEVARTNFALVLSATSGACWVDATNSTTGTPYFVGTLEPGREQTFTANSPVTVVLGAPTALVASVDGTTVQLPSGYSTPFTMSFAAAPPAA
jgi:hypothetical protein